MTETIWWEGMLEVNEYNSSFGPGKYSVKIDDQPILDEIMAANHRGLHIYVTRGPCNHEGELMIRIPLTRAVSNPPTPYLCGYLTIRNNTQVKIVATNDEDVLAMICLANM